MKKKAFKAESKRLLDLMINSIYTHKEIFLREIISNASDACDKLCYQALTDDSVKLTRKDFKIELSVDKDARTITVADNGIGMDKEEIVKIARKIGTFDTSILPYEDCCTIFTPPHPKIRPELAEILEAEAAMPGLAALEAEAAESAERIRIRITDQVEFEG